MLWLRRYSESCCKGCRVLRGVPKGGVFFSEGLSQMSHEDRIADANNAVLGLRKEMNKDFYPVYHMAPYAGWMNDPNGLVFFKGLYHVFFQHHPFSADWGLMHWGHLSSEDMVHWRHHPTALAPGDDWDRDGCFSGSAVVHDEKLYLFYTGHHWLSDALDDTQIYQVQCLAVSEDGFSFEKRGIVVKPPAGFMHCRDPKVWFQDGRWWMVCGARDSRDQGQVLLYSTDDLEDWDDSMFSVLAKDEDRNVYMWECPDFFPLQKHNVLVFSPQGMSGKGFNYRNRYQSGYLVGKWKPEFSFDTTTKFKELDYGHDFYAPQTFLTRDGRRVVIGWLGMWEGNVPTRAHKWSGLLSIPRELQLDEQTGKLRCRPIRELEKLRKVYQYLMPQEVKENTSEVLIENCSSCEVKITWNVENSTAEKYGLWLGRGFEISVDDQTRRLVVNRHYPDYCISGYRSYPLPSRALLSLHMFLDRSSAEVFVNDGECVLSSRIYPAANDRVLSAFALNGKADIVGCDIWALELAAMQ